MGLMDKFKKKKVLQQRSTKLSLRKVLIVFSGGIVVESCHKCGCEFSYIEKLKALSSVNFKGEIKCKKCGCLHKVERHNLLMPALFALPMLLGLFLIQQKTSSKMIYYFILGYLLYDACLKLLEPLFTKIVAVKKK